MRGHEAGKETKTDAGLLVLQGVPRLKEESAVAMVNKHRPGREDPTRLPTGRVTFH